MLNMNKSNVVGVRVDPDLVERINAYAAHLGDAYASQAIRRLIRLGLEVAERETIQQNVG